MEEFAGHLAGKLREIRLVEFTIAAMRVGQGNRRVRTRPMSTGQHWFESAACLIFLAEN
jgi:hypothetical protein